MTFKMVYNYVTFYKIMKIKIQSTLDVIFRDKFVSLYLSIIIQLVFRLVVSRHWSVGQNVMYLSSASYSTPSKIVGIFRKSC